MKPYGALESQKDDIQGPIYAVYFDGRFRDPPFKSEHIRYVGNWWFNGTQGFIFTNYFHAYAFRLKCKQNNDQQKSHKALS